MMKSRSRLPIILLGVLLVAIITPVSQFLTISSLDAAIETATPVGWAIGMAFSAMLALAAMRLVSRSRLFGKENVVILYCMLTIAVPVMNLGLVRPLFHSLTSVLFEYMYEGTSTYRTAYNARQGSWFPVVPDREGLAWNKADRLLRLLEDPERNQERLNALRRVSQAVSREVKLLNAGPAAAASPPSQTLPPDWSALQADIALLGVGEIESIWSQKNDAALSRLGIAALLKARYQAAFEASQQAVRSLAPLLADADEFEVSQLPSNIALLDPGSLKRLRMAQRQLSPDQQRRDDAEVARLGAMLPTLTEQVTNLSETDFAKLRAQLEAALLTRYTALDGPSLDSIRASFVYRLTREERRALMSQAGEGGTPNENLKAFRLGLWSDLASVQEKDRGTFLGNLGEVVHRLPWSLWARPLLLWALFLLAMFLLIMCAAEWFRRKWVDRENLAFPLVEVADSIIRHDALLETADDIRAPEPRGRLFSAMFLLGCAAGFAMLSIEALGHYQIIGKTYVLMFDVSKQIFTTGGLKEMDKVVLVISPIVVGLLYLVSLEISFSVWMTFLIYKLLVLIPKLSGADIKDSSFTGYGGGREYPFPMEQMLGACLCFAALLVYKSFTADRRTKEAAGPANYFIPPALTRAGFIILPLSLLAMCWSMGVSNFPLLLLAGLVAAAQTIAAARVRAETGLPTQQVSYEFSKLPLVFGMTGSTGASVYTVFLSLAFLPVSLLFRTLPQHLENMELARRFKIKYQTVALSAIIAFLTALGVGMLAFLVFSYYRGEGYNGYSVYPGFVPDNISAGSIAAYPLWISHFRGEEGLGKFTDIHWVRLWFMLAGGAIFSLLTFLRGRFLKFPLHPLGYIIVLLSLWYQFISPYVKGDSAGTGNEVSFLWGGAFLAWLLKKLIIKYGGMNAYKRSKPFFIGLVAGSVLAIFAWNILDLGCAIAAEQNPNVTGFVKYFAEKPPYSPRFY